MIAFERIGVALAALFVVSCKAPTVARDHASASTDAAASLGSSATAVAPLPPSALPDASPCRKLVLVDACVVSAPLEDPDRDAFFTTRHAAPPKIELPEYCQAMTVGAGREPALRCQRTLQPTNGTPPGSPTHAYRVMMSEVIYVVRAGRPVVVFDKAVLLDVFDKEVLDAGPLFAMKVDIPLHTEAFDLAEPAIGACAEAARKVAADSARAAHEPPASRATALAWARLDEQLVKRMCDSAGRYVWNNGTFTREPATHPTP